MKDQGPRSFVIGDVHACLAELRRLLHKIEYRSAYDRIIFAGDLVGRGPHPLKTIEFVRALGPGCVNVMGNHDLALIARAWQTSHSSPRMIARRWRTAIQWLARSPFLYDDEKHGVIVTHAGVPPQLSISEAKTLAHSLERRMHEDGQQLALRLIAAPLTDFSRVRSSDECARFIATGLTRMKLCASDGSLDLSHKGAPDAAPPQLRPWFRMRNIAHDEGRTLIYGHWAALGVHHENQSLCIDDGCVFGGALAAVELTPTLPVTRVYSQVNATVKMERTYDA